MSLSQIIISTEEIGGHMKHQSLRFNIRDNVSAWATYHLSLPENLTFSLYYSIV